MTFRGFPLLAACLLLGLAVANRQGEAAPEPANAASAARVRLLSQEQYFNSLAYVFGPDIAVASHFAPFRRTDGLLESGAAAAGVTVGQMQEFQRTAGAVAEKVMSPANRNFLIPCMPRSTTGPDDQCAGRFLGQVGRLLFRRPLTAAERTAYVTESRSAAVRLKDFYGGLEVVLEGMLISPNMLFVVDRTEADPREVGRARLDSWSLASRLSLFLWNAAPDDALLNWAAHGDLQNPEGRKRAVDYMLESPRLETGVRAFFDDMLGFDEFAVLSKDPGIYPSFIADTITDAREQTLRTIVDQLIVGNRDYRGLYTTRETFMSPPLAPLYGVSAPPGWTRYESPAGSARVGLLTQVAFLASHAHPGRSSATLRGKALRELLLCQKVPRPPPNVDFSLIEDPKSTLLTARERLAAHRANPVCAGCHKLTDPIGLGLENFDGAGQYRATERGAPIDASGNLDGKAFPDAPGLAEALHDNPALPACLVTRVYSYATGGTPASGSNDMLGWFGTQFAEQGYKLPALLRTVALSNAFSTISIPAVKPGTVAQLAPGATQGTP
jgi:hypothetical protein